MYSTTLIISLLLLTILVLFKKTRNYLNLPGPSSYLSSYILGHEYLVFTHPLASIHSIWAKQFGPFFKINAALFHPHIIVLSDHTAAHHIFADTTNYVKSPAFRPPIENL